MRFARLNTPISFVRIVNGKDPDTRENVKTQVTVHSCFAEIREQKLREKYVHANMGSVLQDSVTFIIRYQQKVEIEGDMRVVYNRKAYEIIDILPNSQDKDLINVIVKKVS